MVSTDVLIHDYCCDFDAVVPSVVEFVVVVAATFGGWFAIVSLVVAE